MDPMKSDFIIKRNKKGKSESALIKGEGEKEKGIQTYYSFFSFRVWRALKKSWDFRRNPRRLLV